MRLQIKSTQGEEGTAFPSDLSYVYPPAPRLPNKCAKKELESDMYVFDIFARYAYLFLWIGPLQVIENCWAQYFVFGMN